MGGKNGGGAEGEEPTNIRLEENQSGAMMPRENSSKKSESILLNATGDQVR